MSHEITATDGLMLGGRTPAWHGLGTVIDADVVTTKEAMEIANLNWTVEQHPVCAMIESPYEPSLDTTDTIPAHEYVANVRSDTRTVLAVVGCNYVPVQNSEAFAFMDDMLGGGDAHWHTVGSLDGGRKVWALARLNRDIMIGGDPNEKIDPFICLATSHDATLSLTVYTTPVRVVCMNTLRWSLAGTRNAWRTRHTTDVKARIAIARETLGMATKYFDELQTIGDQLITQHMSKSGFESMLETLVPLPPESDDMGGKMRRTYAETKRDLITAAWNVDNLANVKYTRWGFVQAVAEYEDWIRSARSDEHRARRVLLGDQYSMKTGSVEIALHS